MKNVYLRHFMQLPNPIIDMYECFFFLSMSGQVQAIIKSSWLMKTIPGYEKKILEWLMSDEEKTKFG